MLFNSYSFLLFFLIVVIMYLLYPGKKQTIWLLAVSYFFYMCWDVRYVLLLLFSTVVSYVGGLQIKRYLGGVLAEINSIPKIIIFVSVVLNLGVLVFFKYLNFFVQVLNVILDQVDLFILTPKYNLLLPAGISFYIFHFLCYLIDVYRREVPTEHHFVEYALFISFFPQLTAGLIECAKSLIRQIQEEHTFQVDAMRNGLLLMSWGYFLKLMTADGVSSGTCCTTALTKLFKFGKELDF